MAGELRSEDACLRKLEIGICEWLRNCRGEIRRQETSVAGHFIPSNFAVPEFCFEWCEFICYGAGIWKLQALDS